MVCNVLVFHLLLLNHQDNTHSGAMCLRVILINQPSVIAMEFKKRFLCIENKGNREVKSFEQKVLKYRKNNDIDRQSPT